MAYMRKDLQAMSFTLTLGLHETHPNKFCILYYVYLLWKWYYGTTVSVPTSKRSEPEYLILSLLLSACNKNPYKWWIFRKIVTGQQSWCFPYFLSIIYRVILPKFGQDDNWNCHGYQILVKFTKNCSCDQFQLSSRPNFHKIYQNLVIRPISIVIFTKNWSCD